MCAGNTSSLCMFHKGSKEEWLLTVAIVYLQTGAAAQASAPEKDAGLVRELLAAAMHSRAAYGYAMQVCRRA